MNKEEIFDRAAKYLEKRKIEFVKPGTFGMHEGDKVEVIYLVPDALDPNVVIDPPDVRFFVDTKTGEVIFIDQM